MRPNKPDNVIPQNLVALVAFKSKDNIALSFLHLAMEDNVDQNIETTDTSHEAWSTISSLYEWKDNLRAIMLKTCLCAIPFASSIPSHDRSKVH